MIRVLIVDDSALMRKRLREILMADPDIEVIATARDGLDGVNKARELRPDVVTMDINMPGLDGISALQILVKEAVCPVIIVSSLSQEGALITLEAMELGAFDFVGKPGGTISLNLAEVSAELIAKVHAASEKRVMRRLKRQAARLQEQEAEGAAAPRRSTRAETPRASRLERASRAERPERLGVSRTDYDSTAITDSESVTFAVTIGISTGGPKTILDVLPLLPANLGAPVFIVQHMPPAFTSSFAERLNKISIIPVMEAVAGETVYNNVAYLAKGGQHLLLRRNNTGKISLRLSTVPPNLFVPSVDVMMESVFSLFGENMVSVLMTGMGCDGAATMVRVRKAGGYTIAESEETAIVYGMPREAIERGGADIVLPSYQIADAIIRKIDQWKQDKK